MRSAGAIIEVLAAHYQRMLATDDVQRRASVDHLALEQRRNLRRPCKSRIPRKGHSGKADRVGTQCRWEALDSRIRGQIILAHQRRVSRVIGMYEPSGNGEQHPGSNRVIVIHCRIVLEQNHRVHHVRPVPSAALRVADPNPPSGNFLFGVDQLVQLHREVSTVLRLGRKSLEVVSR